MKETIKKIEEMLLKAKWSNEFDLLENPYLLANTCLYIVSEFCNPNFNKEEFAKEIVKDSYTREMFRVTFYESLCIRKKLNRLSKREMSFCEKEDSKTIMEFWERSSKYNFVFTTPIFCAETYWMVVLSDALVGEDITFPEFFATTITYALSNEVSEWVMEVLRTILEYCTDTDAKTTSAIIGQVVVLPIELPVKNINTVTNIGTLFVDANTNKVMVYADNTNENLVLAKKLFTLSNAEFGVKTWPF